MKNVSKSEFSCDKNTTCCFTGHRRKDLPFEGDVHKQGMKCLLSMLQLLIEEAVCDGYKTFISGMAEGIDLFCAEIVHNLIVTKKYPDLKLICALPYAEQAAEIRLPLDKYRYSMLISNCYEQVIISSKYEKERYKLRNRFMVENSSRIIGAYKAKKHGSGTLQTINMADKAGLDLQIISLDRNPCIYIDSDNPPNYRNFKKFRPEY